MIPKNNSNDNDGGGNVRGAECFSLLSRDAAITNVTLGDLLRTVHRTWDPAYIDKAVYSTHILHPSARSLYAFSYLFDYDSGDWSEHGQCLVDMLEKQRHAYSAYILSDMLIRCTHEDDDESVIRKGLLDARAYTRIYAISLKLTYVVKVSIVLNGVPIRSRSPVLPAASSSSSLYDAYLTYIEHIYDHLGIPSLDDIYENLLITSNKCGQHCSSLVPCDNGKYREYTIVELRSAFDILIETKTRNPIDLPSSALDDLIRQELRYAYIRSCAAKYTTDRVATTRLLVGSRLRSEVEKLVAKTCIDESVSIESIARGVESEYEKFQKQCLTARTNETAAYKAGLDRAARSAADVKHDQLQTMQKLLTSAMSTQKNIQHMILQQKANAHSNSEAEIIAPRAGASSIPAMVCTTATTLPAPMLVGMGESTGRAREQRSNTTIASLNKHVSHLTTRIASLQRQLDARNAELIEEQRQKALCVMKNEVLQSASRISEHQLKNMQDLLNAEQRDGRRRRQKLDGLETLVGDIVSRLGCAETTRTKLIEKINNLVTTRAAHSRGGQQTSTTATLANNIVSMLLTTTPNSKTEDDSLMASSRIAFDLVLSSVHAYPVPLGGFFQTDQDLMENNKYIKDSRLYDVNISTNDFSSRDEPIPSVQLRYPSEELSIIELNPIDELRRQEILSALGMRTTLNIENPYELAYLGVIPRSLDSIDDHIVRVLKTKWATITYRLFKINISDHRYTIQGQPLTPTLCVDSMDVYVHPFHALLIGESNKYHTASSVVGILCAIAAEQQPTISINESEENNNSRIQSLSQMTYYGDIVIANYLSRVIQDHPAEQYCCCKRKRRR